MALDDGSVPDDTLLALHAASQELWLTTVAGAASADLTADTPCADWDLRALLEHQLGQGAGLAAAVQGGGAALADWQPQPLGPDPLASLAASARTLVAALALRGLRGTVWMPEISPTAEIPIRSAVLAHLIDSVVHSWDVAAGLGAEFDVEPALLQVAAAVARQVPAGASRLRPGAAFGPALPDDDHSGPVRAETAGTTRAPQRIDVLSGMLAHLGRDSHFTPLAFRR